MDLKNFLTSWNTTLTVFVVFPAIVLLGAYLTLRLKCVQLTKLRLSFRQLVTKETKSEGTISHYQAISSVLAGNFGTGNISGMAIAIAAGGPGALVWMWVMAFFGAAIQYASCILGVLYRKKDSDGQFAGGPMYYLKHGLGYKKLGIAFSIATLFGAFTVGNLAQVHSVALPLEQLGIPPLASGFLVAALTCVVILGGIERIAKVASSVVPVMAFFYLLATVIILGTYADKVLPAFWIMIDSAFDLSSAMGGLFGYGVMQAVTTGFHRGLFATDAGTGIVPILQASAKTKHPVIDGVVTLITPFLVMAVCTATGLVLLVTDAWQVTGLHSTNMVTYAFEKGLNQKLGFYTVMVSLFLFAYTTIIAWAACGQKAVEFLSPNHKKLFQIAYIAIIPIGTIAHVDLIWALADLCISFMLLINLVGVAGLSEEVISASRNYFNKEQIGQVA